MAMRKGLPAQDAKTQADDTRYDFKNLIVSNKDGSVRGGLVSPVAQPVVVGQDNLNVLVNSFAAVAVRDGGVVLLSNWGGQYVSVAEHVPLSNSRIVLICARQNDKSTTVTAPDSDNEPRLYAVPGAVSATPASPQVPAGSVEVGRLQIASGKTSTNTMTIAQTGRFTCGAGGSVPFLTIDELRSWTTAQTGQRAHGAADGAGLYWDGDSWASSGGEIARITPSSVLGGQVSPSGKVTFTNVPAVTLLGIGSTEFDHLQIEFQGKSTGGTVLLVLSMRSGGNDVGGDDYQYVFVETKITQGPERQAHGDNVYGRLGTISPNEGGARIDIYGLAAGKFTRWESSSQDGELTTNVGAGRHTVPDPYTGLTIKPASGNFTGTIIVRGVRS